ncbi:RNA polymerase sigma factor [Caballeronia sordidicola]|uniref:RNA polymerase sigma factor n=1 Tax=Caballeronia sordidicola TaxID=196367 RepID=A0A158FWH9_CABSO|nr:RNA polymerase sigma factor [Caballeronia sordidicola]
MGKSPPNRFDQVMLPHLDAAYNLARWLSGSATEADDVVQEAFLRAFRFFDGYTGDNPRAWLLAIVRNTWFTEWRRHRHQGDATPMTTRCTSTTSFPAGPTKAATIPRR